MEPSHWHARRGFALVIVISLLALLVLAVYSLSVVGRVSAQVTTTSGYRVQARQNALLALSLGQRELQRFTGDDGCVTGMAGITGINAGAGNTTRNWCGVWRTNGSFVAWLVSGAQSSPTAALQTGIPAIRLVANGSVGASAAQSEHVIAGKLPIVVSDASGPGSNTAIGSYAFVVLDEGIKVSAYHPAAQSGSSLSPVLTSVAPTSAQRRLRAALDQCATRAGELVSYEQLALLRAPSSALTPSTLQDNFHHVTLTALRVDEDGLQSGVVNLNTASRFVWRSLLETYNTAPGVTPIPATRLASIGDAIAGGLAATSSGKSADGPFTSVDHFGASAVLVENLPEPITPEEFMAVIGSVLTVRSDTFRIRAYGEAHNPARSGVVEAVAWCEAIVQRTTAPLGNGTGRRYVITYFRWLGPEDV